MKRKSILERSKSFLYQFQRALLSILTLMMLGTLALVGLKVTTPNMHRTAQRFIDQQEMLDLAVMGDLGLDKTDQEELQRIDEGPAWSFPT